MLYIAAATQVRLDIPGRASYRRKLAAGKTRMAAIRCLKRRISDAVYRQSPTPDTPRTSSPPRQIERVWEGTARASLTSSAVDLRPHFDTEDQPLPGPANPTLQPFRRTRKTTALTAG